MVVKIKFYNTGSFTKALVSSEGHTKLCQRSNLFQYLLRKRAVPKNNRLVGLLLLELYASESRRGFPLLYL